MANRKGPQATEVSRLLGQNLIAFRGHVGLSQEATAERAGLHRTEVAYIEGGKRLPRLDTIVKLGGAVEVSPCELLVGIPLEARLAERGIEMKREPSLLGARFGRNHFYSRRFTGLSQQELADLVGMNRVNLGELERGLRLPRADTIVKLAAGMEISTCVLLEGMVWHPGPQARDGEFYVEHPASTLRRSVRR